MTLRLRLARTKWRCPDLQVVPTKGRRPEIFEAVREVWGLYCRKEGSMPHGRRMGWLGDKDMAGACPVLK
jgi:hypothetical protein